MKRESRAFLYAMLLPQVLLTSCTLQTEDPPLPIVKPANNLVINEVFTLPTSNQRAYSWIEFYNPTKDTIGTFGWTLSLTSTGEQFRVAIDLNGQVIISSFQILRQGEGVWEVPIPEYVIKAGEFLTVTNNEERLLTYSDYGPGKGPKVSGLLLRTVTNNVERTLIYAGTFIQLITLTQNPDSTKPDTVVNLQVQFQLRTSDQLVLKDRDGNVVDVVRYGNYTYNGTGADPYPNNRSIGVIPEFQSIARYNGGYYTGNTADDFYITGTVPLTRPIPHWLSQAYKQ